MERVVGVVLRELGAGSSARNSCFIPLPHTLKNSVGQFSQVSVQHPRNVQREKRQQEPWSTVVTAGAGVSKCTNFAEVTRRNFVSQRVEILGKPKVFTGEAKAKDWQEWFFVFEEYSAAGSAKAAHGLKLLNNGGRALLLAQVSLTDKVVAANLYMLIMLPGWTALALVQLTEVGG